MTNSSSYETERTSTNEVLQRVRASLLEETDAEFGCLLGTTNQHGTNSTFQFAQSHQGYYRRTTEGALPFSQGYDGTISWEQDWCGATRELHLSDRDRLHLTNLIQFGGWLKSSHGLQYSVNRDHSSGSEVALEIRFGDSFAPAMLVIDRQSFLPSRLEIPSTANTESVEFSDFRSRNGVRVPHCTKYQIGDDCHQESITGCKTQSEMDFTIPRTDFSNVSFNEPSGRLVTKRAQTGHILVRLSINGTQHWFILDTGAGGTTIDSRLIDSIQPECVGSIGILSMFGKTQSSVFRLDELDFGTVQLKNVFGIMLDTAFLDEAMGETISGIVGYDLFSKCCMEFGLSSDRFLASDPCHQLDDSIDWQPLLLDRRLPLFPAQLNDLPHGNFRIDIGASGEFFSNLVVHTPYNLQQRLSDTYGTENFELSSHRFKTGVVPKFSLAGTTFENPYIGFAMSDDPPFNDVYSHGNIGVEFLSPFSIRLDYPNRRYAISPI